MESHEVHNFTSQMPCHHLSATQYGDLIGITHLMNARITSDGCDILYNEHRNTWARMNLKFIRELFLH